MWLWHFIYRIIAFPGSLTVVTILAGFVAWFVYDKQRSDQRRDAAKMIFSEIEHAEHRVPALKKTLKVIEANGIPDSMRLLNVDNWDSAQYLLSGELPDDVVETIGEFYTYCRLIDQSLAYIDGFFAKNEAAVRENAFRVNAQYAVELLEQAKSNPRKLRSIDRKNEEAAARIKEKLDAFKQNWPTFYTYNPVKPTNDIKNYLELLPIGLIQGRVGMKLRLARLGKMRRILAGEWVNP